MVVELIGIIVILMGIYQIYVARKTYYNIKKNVKNPQPYVFYGVYFSLILGIIFLVAGAFLIR
ncbi:hypothetical protein [Companilactobacillus halodurans]|uniref:Immunity protein n=1 Tax=Companilactobacillus halodurans TaxID=2584183 RepID=A0A5P0ZY45_9LACO|nr:hypothetical protein [Companilactobacillus halodurans]MQS75244.1 hypothetical protein [Companilactobacillus halodurans]MQS97940.1 hypothetical protein [Companilactobacillus halodurans]